MIFTTLILSLILILHLFVLSAGSFLVRFGMKRKVKNKSLFLEENELPFVSILVAARNEENNIRRCLESLNALGFPKQNYEVLIGNDQSEDNTGSVVNEYIKDKPNFRLINIKENLGKAKGKANVLAHLAHEAKGKYFFITDADIAINPDWINCFLPFLYSPETYVSGTTIVKGSGFWSNLQEMEWILFNAIYRCIDEFQPVAAAGNNMALSAEAYWKTGGYENIEFSVTEDYQLFKEMKKLGYKHRQILRPCSLGLSLPVGGFASLLRQRKRWLVGGRDLPFFMWVLLTLYALFLPALVGLFFLSLPLALMFLVFKVLLDGVFMYVTAKRVNFLFKLWLMPVFEIYLYILNILVFIYFFIPVKVYWKGRKY